MQNHAYRIPRVIQYLRAITALDRMFAIGVGRDPRELVRQQRPLEVIMVGLHPVVDCMRRLRIALTLHSF